MNVLSCALSNGNLKKARFLLDQKMSFFVRDAILNFRDFAKIFVKKIS